ncbi:membrane protein [Spirochaetia bacterium]|nr:membrane protein [Spirochaetia bacterium]
MKRTAFLGTIILFLYMGPSLSAQTVEGASNRGDYLTLKIAVMGPGDELYFWWGHIALIIEDAATGQSRFFDYGLFSFENERFFVNFAFGRLLYSCGASPTELNLRGYRETNRDITLYTLDLPAETREAVRRFAETNILPENRDYYYHHFKNNCVTPILNIIDTATGGQFKAEFGEAPGRYTLRQHVRRHTWFNPFFDWLLNFLMGQDIDTPITVWEELFLPQELGNRIADFSYTDASGHERKLVSSVEVLNRAVGRPLVLDVPRKQWPQELLVGIIIAAILIGLRVLRHKKPDTGRVVWGSAQALLGLFFGIAGTVLCFMTFFTNHDYTWHNSNILYINPLLLAAVPLGIMLAVTKNVRKRFMAEQFLKSLWTYVLLGGLLSMAIKLAPGFYQQNQVTQALVLPFVLVLSFIPDWVTRRGKKARLD